MRRSLPRPAALLLAGSLALAGCVAGGPVTETPVGSVEHAGVTYPLVAVNGAWQVITPDGKVPCRSNSEHDCYWTMRNYLTAKIWADEIDN